MRILSEEYLNYLKSDIWQKLRSTRLMIDHYRCQICNKPFDLQVHHLNYPELLGTENPFTDLITLCKNCHEAIEDRKRNYDPIAEAKERATIRQEVWKKARQAEMEVIRNTIRRNEDNDLYRGGKRDYCNQDIIKADFGPTCANLEIGYVSRVQEYFRNRRYEVILDMMNRGYKPYQVIEKTGFSYNMVHKVFDRPLNAKTLIEKGEIQP